MTALELVKLPPLMEQTTGRREIAIGLIDGPVAKDHPDFERQNIRELPGRERGACAQLGPYGEVLQLYSHPVIGWPDAPFGLFGLRSIQMATI